MTNEEILAFLHKVIWEGGLEDAFISYGLRPPVDKNVVDMDKDILNQYIDSYCFAHKNLVGALDQMKARLTPEEQEMIEQES